MRKFSSTNKQLASNVALVLVLAAFVGCADAFPDDSLEEGDSRNDTVAATNTDSSDIGRAVQADLPSDANQVVVCTDAWLGGTCKALNIGDYPTAASIGVPNDWISSIKVGASVRAVMFSDANFGGEQSLYESGTHNTLGRNENDTTSSIRVMPNNGTRATFRYLSTNPAQMRGRWAKEAQGLAHSNSHWYVTQNNQIWKYDIGADLGSTPEVKRVGIPSQLSMWGCNHFGDPHFDIAHDKLFVPVEGCGSRVFVAVFDSQLNLVCYDDLFQQENPGDTNASWVAIHPTTGYLYSSGTRLNQTSGLHTYSIDWNAIYSDPNPHWFLNHAIGDKRLYRQDGSSVDLKNTQGGVFSDDGKLFYLTSGSAKCGAGENGADLGGLRVFDLASGKLIAKAGNAYGTFQFENHCGFYDYEEPEGLDYVNMNIRPGPYYGQLHAILLQNRTDAIYLKHYDLN